MVGNLFIGCNYSCIRPLFSKIYEVRFVGDVQHLTLFMVSFSLSSVLEEKEFVSLGSSKPSYS